MIPIIRQWILPMSRIISNAWAAYCDIEAEGVYQHDVLVHQTHFVHPGHPEVHTQNTENTWMRAKRKLRRQYGTSESLFVSYLNELFQNYEM